jgi:hypothetical protein
MYQSKNSPQAYHTKNYNQVDKKVPSRCYRKPVKDGYDVASFLRVKDRATGLISPVTYNQLDSFKKTQVQTAAKISLRARQKGSTLDIAVKRASNTPGAGHYSIENINRAFSKLSSFGGRRRL